ncbi:MAG: response regulator [bacterium]
MPDIKVLVIEDEKVARKQLARFVEQQDFKVFKAGDGKEGLEMFEEHQPEIVITDLKMPRLDGREVLRSIRNSSSRTQVIVITAFGTTDTVISAMREGALDYIKKPIDLDQLEVALGRACHNLQEMSEIPPYPTVLLAEDDDITRKKLAGLLQKEGWQVTTASDGSEAVESFKKSKIDLVLLDIKMPGKSGLEALHDMRRQTGDFEAIILTGYGDEENATTALRDGAHNFIRKPIDLDQLVVAAAKALETLKMKRALRYRSRELELTREIIARITGEKEIIIDARDHTQPEAQQFARDMLEALPLELVVVENDFSLLYGNRWAGREASEKPSKIDIGFLEELIPGDPDESQLREVHEAIKNHFAASPGEVRSLKTATAEISITPVKLITESGYNKVMIVAVREV